MEKRPVSRASKNVKDKSLKALQIRYARQKKSLEKCNNFYERIRLEKTINEVYKKLKYFSS